MLHARPLGSFSLRIAIGSIKLCLRYAITSGRLRDRVLMGVVDGFRGSKLTRTWDWTPRSDETVICTKVRVGSRTILI